MKKSQLSNDLLEKTAYLDAFSGARGYLSATAIKLVDKQDNVAISNFLEELAKAKNRIENKTEGKLVLKSVYDLFLQFVGKLKLKELKDNNAGEQSEETETFEILYQRLNDLVGLEKVKNTVNDLIAYHRIQKLRSAVGFKNPNRTLHLAFLGNPGTGKTTVARIVGKMYRQLGLLSKGHFIEVSRTDLIAGYQGQTAHKVKEVITRAKGGVLFIDEAYSLTENDHSDSYGRECLTELTKALEDYRQDLVVIVAGYSDLMHAFFESNPGLKSRFNTFIEFEDYEVRELLGIFEKMCQDDDYVLSLDAKEELSNIITKEISDKPEKFANGRYVRNLYEDVVMNHARRLSVIENPTDIELSQLLTEDLPPQ